jgi:hypothetical protein
MSPKHLQSSHFQVPSSVLPCMLGWCPVFQTLSSSSLASLYSPSFPGVVVHNIGVLFGYITALYILSRAENRLLICDRRLAYLPHSSCKHPFGRHQRGAAGARIGVQDIETRTALSISNNCCSPIYSLGADGANGASLPAAHCGARLPPRPPSPQLPTTATLTTDLAISVPPLRLRPGLHGPNPHPHITPHPRPPPPRSSTHDHHRPSDLRLPQRARRRHRGRHHPRLGSGLLTAPLPGLHVPQRRQPGRFYGCREHGHVGRDCLRGDEEGEEASAPSSQSEARDGGDTDEWAGEAGYCRGERGQPGEGGGGGGYYYPQERESGEAAAPGGG